MFEDSLFVSDTSSRKRSRQAPGPVLVSIGLQALVAGGVLLAPLLWPGSLGEAFGQPRMAEVVLKVAPTIKVEPVKPRVVRVAAASQFVAPAVVERMVEASRGSASLRARAPGTDEAPALLGSGMARVGVLSGLPGFNSRMGSGSGPVVVRGTPERNSGPTRISSGVSSGLLLEPIRPVYPRIAVSARVEGTVVVRAVIDVRGRIVGAEVVSGPAMLRTAALEAIRQARYRPYLLNGLPTDVETTISVNFTLHG